MSSAGTVAHQWPLPNSMSKDQICMRSERFRRHERDALAILQFLQTRRQSSSTSTGRNASEQKPPMPPSKLILRALRQGLSLRPLFSAFRGQNMRTLFRQSPEELVMPLSCMQSLASCRNHAHPVSLFCSLCGCAAVLCLRRLCLFPLLPVRAIQPVSRLKLRNLYAVPCIIPTTRQSEAGTQILQACPRAMRGGWDRPLLR